MLGIVIAGAVLGGPDAYVRVGPGTKDFPLHILSVRIDSWSKWVCTVVIVVLYSLADAIISQTAMNILYNNIYNPAVVTIDNFSGPHSFRLYAHSMYGLNAIRFALSVKISVTQIDFAFIQVIASQLMTISTIRTYLVNKKFGKPNPSFPASSNELNSRVWLGSEKLNIK